MRPAILSGLLLCLSAFPVLLAGCSHDPTEKKVDAQLAQEPAVHSADELQAKTKRLLETSPSVTGKQREKIGLIDQSVRSQLGELNEQSLKIEDLLMRTIVAQDYNEDEVKALKNRLKTIEERKTTLVLNAADRESEAMGHRVQKPVNDSLEFFEPHAGRD